VSANKAVRTVGDRWGEDGNSRPDSIAEVKRSWRQFHRYRSENLRWLYWKSEIPGIGQK
jgi:hypothetical protein